MNKVILIGRLTRDPEVRYSAGADPVAIARYTVAVDRRGRRDDGEQTADFISCIAFRQKAEFAEQYLRKGVKIAVVGHIQTGSYTNKDGQKVFTTDVIVDEQEFVESKANSQTNSYQNNGYHQESPCPYPSSNGDGFMNIPNGIDDELPFK